MADCHWCRREMSSGESCTEHTLHLDGVAWPLARSPRRCGDCGVGPGGFHHPGCDLQQCPRCRRQLITCGCAFDEHRFEDGFEDGDAADESFWDIVHGN